MFKYITRRLLHSLGIILGVVILSFLLFKVAAGDPAAAILGENASPKEVEELRTELGVDLPLFWGNERKTEAFTKVDFSTKHTPPGIIFPDSITWHKSGLLLNKQQTVEFKRNFKLNQSSKLHAKIWFKGNLRCNDKNYFSKSYSTPIEITIPPNADSLSLTPATVSSVIVDKVEFFCINPSKYKSQFLNCLTEIIDFDSKFPYVKLLNFGNTIITREPINNILKRGITPSLILMFAVFVGELVISVVLALLATVYSGQWQDRAIVIISVAGMSVSYLAFIIAGQWYLGYYCNLFPVWGWGDVRYLFLPVIVGIVSGLGGGVRFYRTLFVNELNKEYLRTATAKGCSKINTLAKHMLRNAAIPIVTRASAILPFLFTGSLLLETFFGIPGLGYLGIDALNNADLQLLKAIVIISAILFTATNTITDLIYAWLDPRIRIK